MKLQKRIPQMLLLVASSVALAACQSGGASDKVIVTGDGINITEADLYKELKQTAGEAGVQQLVFQQIFEKELGDAKVKEIDQSIDADTLTMIAQYGGEDKFLEVAQQSGYTTVDAYKKALRYYRLLSETLLKNVNVSDDEVHVAYDAYLPPREISHILVENESEAKEIIKQLNDGADFATLAKEKSIDKASAEKGGSLGNVKTGQMVQEFEKAAFSMKAGEISSEPVQSQYGYHIIKVDKVDKKGAFEEEKDQLTKSLKQSKLQNNSTLQSLMKEILQKYKIEVKDSDLKDAFKNFIETPNSALTPAKSSENSQTSSESTSEANTDSKSQAPSEEEANAKNENSESTAN